MMNMFWSVDGISTSTVLFLYIQSLRNVNNLSSTTHAQLTGSQAKRNLRVSESRLYENILLYIYAGRKDVLTSEPDKVQVSYV